MPGAKTRAIALISTLLMTVVVLIVIGALLSNLMQELGLVRAHGSGNAAVRAAYAGVEDMVYQFELLDSVDSPGVVPPTLSKSYSNDDGSSASYQVTVDDARWDAPLPFYVVHAKGTAGGTTRQLAALIRKQPFSAYQRFTVSEWNNVGGTVWYTPGQEYTGPVYSGGPMNIMYSTDDGAKPIFLDKIITATDPNWWPGNPDDTGLWNNVASGGSGAYQRLNQPLDLPTATDNNLLKSQALYGEPKPPKDAKLPTDPGLYLNGKLMDGGAGGPLKTGMYIVGDKVEVSASGNAVTNTQYFQFKVTSGSSTITYNVYIDFNSKTTIVKDAGGITLATFSGVPSGQLPGEEVGGRGAIYSTGDIIIDDGSSIHGRYTFGVHDGNDAPNPIIRLLGSLTYADKNSTDALALWANDILLNDTKNEDVEVDALILTGYYNECSDVCTDGTFYNENCTSADGPCGGGKGKIKIHGSLVQNVRGKMGTVGTTVSGFLPQGSFDKRLSRNPPPFTPTTNLYEILGLCSDDGPSSCSK